MDVEAIRKRIDKTREHRPYWKDADIQALVTILDALLSYIDELTAKLAEYEAEEKAGRLVRLPCKGFYEKAGDTVFIIDSGEVIEVTHCGAQISADGEAYVIVAAEDNIFPYREPDAEHDTEPGDWCTNAKNVGPDDFGKTVFLDEQSAITALEERRDA